MVSPETLEMRNFNLGENRHKHKRTHTHKHTHTQRKLLHQVNKFEWARRRCTGKIGFVQELEVAQVTVRCGRRLAGAALCRSTRLSARGWQNKAHGNETTLSS